MSRVTSVRDSRLGALVGLAVGDALGTTNEFADLAAPSFPTLAVGPHVEVTGGGPFRVAPGQVTDDTQMAAALATSLHANRRFDSDDVAERYIAWSKVAFDIGNQTSAALRRVAAGAAGTDAGRQVWESGGHRAAGNGSLMRTVPIGVFFADDAEQRRNASVRDSALTHFDPRCMLACAAFNAAVAAGSREGADVPAMFAAARGELELAIQHPVAQSVGGGLLAEAKSALEGDLDAAEREDPELYGDGFHLLRQQGFVRVAFRLAFWELSHAPTFRAGLVDVVNRGGDADTNGAITGALLGAYHGREEIPEDWVDPVFDALKGQHGPFATAYHPLRLLDLLDDDETGTKA